MITRDVCVAWFRCTFYRRSQRGYRCSYDSTEIYHDDDEEGAKMSFKISENQIYISLGSKYIYKTKKIVTSQNIMCLKV